MKQISKYAFILVAVAASQGCSKSFLNRPPISTLTSGNFYKNDAEIAAGTGPLYNIVWFDYNDKSLLAFGAAKGGDLNSNDRTPYIQFDVSATDQQTLLTGYKAFFKIVAQSNVTMQNILGATGSTATTAGINTGLGECHFMRGIAYYYLVSNWGAVPIMYDNVAQLNSPAPRNRIEDVWQFIIMDMHYAVADLPATVTQQGRLTKWSAEAMLAKMYLTRAGLNKTEGSRTQSDLDSAKYYAADVINNSGLQLVPNYYDLFTSADNNSSHNNNENLFALQWQPVNSPWGVNNSFQAYMAFDPKITQTGDGWGAAQGASADLITYYLAHPEDSLRRKATFMFPGDFYPDLDKSDGGINVGNSLNYAYVKKYVVGSPADNGKGAFMAAYVNTYMLRLAEVYLIYAEAIMGNAASTNDAQALKYFNMVRTRAGLASSNSITFNDIFQEKRIETALEGNSWYDVLRWYYFAPAKAKAYVNAQDRSTNYTISAVANSSPRQWNFTTANQHFTLTDQTVYLPFPESEMVAAPFLADPPVAFDFSKLPKQ
jgi:hypothetical protein